MSEATHDQAHETRMRLAGSITSVLVYRFPWLRVNATANAVLRSYLGGAVAGKNDSGLTIEAVMGAMLDALQTKNEEVEQRFAAYVANHGPPAAR